MRNCGSEGTRTTVPDVSPWSESVHLVSDTDRCTIYTVMVIRTQGITSVKDTRLLASLGTYWCQQIIAAVLETAMELVIQPK
jgi:hypothetical protein